MNKEKEKKPDANKNKNKLLLHIIEATKTPTKRSNSEIRNKICHFLAQLYPRSSLLALIVQS